jgi:hypothetical protein
VRRLSSEVRWNVLLLQVAVCDVVVAPVRHRIELQAVRKLHLFCLAKLLELLPPLSIPLAFTCALACCRCAPIQLLELEALGVELNVTRVAEGVQGGRCGWCRRKVRSQEWKAQRCVRARLVNGVGSGGGAAFGHYLQAVLARGDWRGWWCRSFWLVSFSCDEAKKMSTGPIHWLLFEPVHHHYGNTSLHHAIDCIAHVTSA